MNVLSKERDEDTLKQSSDDGREDFARFLIRNGMGADAAREAYDVRRERAQHDAEEAGNGQRDTERGSDADGLEGSVADAEAHKVAM